MISASLAFIVFAIPLALGCSPLTRRSEVEGAPEWTYEATADWGNLDPEYHLCQTGTQQSPIHLRLDQGLSSNVKVSFDYPRNVKGVLTNGGHGPSFAIDHPEGEYTSLPATTFEIDGTNETVYLVSWHTHTPGEHIVSGVRTMAVLHFVHVDAKGDYRSVVWFRIHPGAENFESPFFGQLPKYVGANETEGEMSAEVDHSLALEQVSHLKDFWTYQGSLTSPPCKEGLRWFVAREVLFVSDVQMQDLLQVSSFSAREEQDIWRHGVAREESGAAGS
ncbi:hypothetical protein LTR17_009402 [Elasticomyces elasticus]|nr:hypothetical protein LTR17_009402 [Elasticomyces elasticus]